MLVGHKAKSSNTVVLFLMPPSIKKSERKRKSAAEPDFMLLEKLNKMFF